MVTPYDFIHRFQFTRTTYSINIIVPCKIPSEELSFENVSYYIRISPTGLKVRTTLQDSITHSLIGRERVDNYFCRNEIISRQLSSRTTDLEMHVVMRRWYMFLLLIRL